MSLPAALAVSLALAAGLLLAASAVPGRRRRRLDERLDPYLRGLLPARSRLLARDEAPLAGLPDLLRPLLTTAARQGERWLGGTASVARRLGEAGRPDEVGRFRAEQVLWALAGFGGALAIGLALPVVLDRDVAPLATLLLAGTGTIAGAGGRDWWLGQEVARRQARLLAEFPTIADLLCLAVTAGESPHAALERITRRARGELAEEIARALADTRAGTPLTVALERLADRTALPPVSRFVDGLVVAVERGTPLAGVLRAQAADIREQRKRHLIEDAGRREIAMLVPVVFLILPVVVLFALYPGLFSLSLLAP